MEQYGIGLTDRDPYFKNLLLNSSVIARRSTSNKCKILHNQFCCLGFPCTTLSTDQYWLASTLTNHCSEKMKENNWGLHNAPSCENCWWCIRNCKTHTHTHMIRVSIKLISLQLDLPIGCISNCKNMGAQFPKRCSLVLLHHVNIV